MEPRNRFYGMNSASYVAWRAVTPIPPRFLAPIDSLKIPALLSFCHYVDLSFFLSKNRWNVGHFWPYPPPPPHGLRWANIHHLEETAGHSHAQCCQKFASAAPGSVVWRTGRVSQGMCFQSSLFIHHIPYTLCTHSQKGRRHLPPPFT